MIDSNNPRPIIAIRDTHRGLSENIMPAGSTGKVCAQRDDLYLICWDARSLVRAAGIAIYGAVIFDGKEYEDDHIANLISRKTKTWHFAGDQSSDEASIQVNGESFADLNAALVRIKSLLRRSGYQDWLSSHPQRDIEMLPA